MKTFTDELNGKEYFVLENEDGSYISGLKSDYDAQQAASTLPSNSSIPQAGE